MRAIHPFSKIAIYSALIAMSGAGAAAAGDAQRLHSDARNAGPSLESKTGRQCENRKSHAAAQRAP